MIRALAIVAAIALSIALPFAAWGQDAARCGEPPSLQLHVGELPKLARAVRNNTPVRVLILSTAMGSGLTTMDQAYPSRFQYYLQRRLPKLPMTMATSVKAGETAVQMLRALRKGLVNKPDLVIWQTGTVDAAQQLDAAGFAQALIEGRSAIRETGAELVLIGPQFSRRAGAIVEFRPYIEEMVHVEQAYGVPLLDRFAIMRYWADHGLVNLDGDRDTWAATAAFVHDCIGAFLAEKVLKAVGIE